VLGDRVDEQEDPPSRSSRVVGEKCRTAAWSPAATIVSNARKSPPLRRNAASSIIVRLLEAGTAWRSPLSG
jgi:hypothetical protein